VTVTFTCSDKTSGVASCPAPVTISTEIANKLVSGTATDLAGNTATASVNINLDMTPPTITGIVSPAPDAGGYNSGPVTVHLPARMCSAASLLALRPFPSAEKGQLRKLVPLSTLQATPPASPSL
jgi:hypothetical protein